jgi:intein/homing endonuclease
VDCKKLELIKKGKLNEIILDTYSSKMLNKKSNGRCGGTTNCYFENGKITKTDLMKDIKKGDELLSFKSKNSKIISIKKAGKERVYDFKVPEYHNFILGNSILSLNSWKSTLAGVHV